MVTVKELQAQAKAYGIPGRSKLNKSGLIKAIVEARAKEVSRQARRAVEPGRHLALQRDVLNPHKKGRRAHKRQQIEREADVALRAKAVQPRLQQKVRRRLVDQEQRPRLHGL